MSRWYQLEKFLKIHPFIFYTILIIFQKPLQFINLWPSLSRKPEHTYIFLNFLCNMHCSRIIYSFFHFFQIFFQFFFEKKKNKKREKFSTSVSFHLEIAYISFLSNPAKKWKKKEEKARKMKEIARHKWIHVIFLLVQP